MKPVLSGFLLLLLLHAFTLFACRQIPSEEPDGRYADVHISYVYGERRAVPAEDVSLGIDLLRVTGYRGNPMDGEAELLQDRLGGDVDALVEYENARNIVFRYIPLEENVYFYMEMYNIYNSAIYYGINQEPITLKEGENEVVLLLDFVPKTLLISNHDSHSVTSLETPYGWNAPFEIGVSYPMKLEFSFQSGRFFLLSYDTSTLSYLLNWIAPEGEEFEGVEVNDNPVDLGFYGDKTFVISRGPDTAPPGGPSLEVLEEGVVSEIPLGSGDFRSPVGIIVNKTMGTGWILDAPPPEDLYDEQGLLYLFDAGGEGFLEPLEGFEIGVNPVMMALNGDENYLFVANAGSPDPTGFNRGSITILDVSVDSPIILTSLYDSSGMSLNYPVHVALSPDGGWALVCNRGRSQAVKSYRLSLYNISNITDITGYNLYLTIEDEPCYGPFKAVFSSDSGYFYAVTRDDLAVTPETRISSFFVIKTEDGTTEFSLVSDRPILDLLLSPDERFIYILKDGEPGSIQIVERRIDPEDSSFDTFLDLGDVIEVENSPYSMAMEY